MAVLHTLHTQSDLSSRITFVLYARFKILFLCLTYKFHFTVHSIYNHIFLVYILSESSSILVWNKSISSNKFYIHFKKKKRRLMQFSKSRKIIWKQFYCLSLKIYIKRKKLVYYRTTHIWACRIKIWRFSLIFSHTDFVFLPQNY